jgi:hypothetical protein
MGFLFAQRGSNMKRIATLILILLCLASASATPKPDNPAKQIIGTWRLVSFEGGPPGLYDDHPKGIIMYEPSGWMAAQLARHRDQPSAQNGSYTQALRVGRTVEEKAAAFDSYVAYYGTYEVDAKKGTVTHHMEDGLIPNLRGANNVRYFEFQGNDRLVLFVAEGPGGNLLPRKDTTVKLIWERIK